MCCSAQHKDDLDRREEEEEEDKEEEDKEEEDKEEEDKEDEDDDDKEGAFRKDGGIDGDVGDDDEDDVFFSGYLLCVIFKVLEGKESALRRL